MVTLPTNGALMTAAQFDELYQHIESQGTPLEKAMYLQMSYMVHGATAHRLRLEDERTKRMTAEARAQALELQLFKARTVLNKPVGKMKLKDLRSLVDSALAELALENSQ